MVAFYTKHSQRQSYKKKCPLGLPFSLFCLKSVLCHLTAVPNFDSEQGLRKWARLKYYPQMHAFTWTVMERFSALLLICETASVTLTLFYWFLSYRVDFYIKKRVTWVTFSTMNLVHLVFLSKWCGDAKGFKGNYSTLQPQWETLKK